MTAIAGALYDGGWRSADRDEIMCEYDLTPDEADTICKELDMLEKSGQPETYLVRLSRWLYDSGYTVSDIEYIKAELDLTLCDTIAISDYLTSYEESGLIPKIYKEFNKN